MPTLLPRLFFFFQAEDGIRDLTVTGVQTCALPISLTRNVPISSPIVPPRPLPSSTMGARAVSISRALRRGAVLVACMPIAPLAAQQPAGPAWTRGAVCYEVFVRSFYDSDGDGIGDLNGLVKKLDYIDKLGASC